MAAPNEAIRQLYVLRDKHRHRIAQIDAALAALGQDVSIDELVIVGAPRTIELREAVLGTLTATGSEALDVATLYAGATDRGWRTLSDNPRNAFASALSRLAQAGDIEKAARGLYRLPTSTAAAA